jgi:hypothetical protein
LVSNPTRGLAVTNDIVMTLLNLGQLSKVTFKTSQTFSAVVDEPDLIEADERDAIQNEAASATRQTIPQELMLSGLMKQAAHLPYARSATTAKPRSTASKEHRA